MNRLITSVLVGLVGMNAMIQAESSRPKLVVGIMVDQLRSDYIDYLRELFGERGFKLLADSGLNLSNVDFRATLLNSPVGAAEIMTGSYPRVNGVTRSTTTEATPLSPEQLLVSTLSDELAIDGGGMANIYAIAPDEATAIVLAGHAANGAVWLNPQTGQWATSSYYGATPQAVSLRNGKQSPAARVDTMTWQPLLPIDRYPGVAPQKKFYPFRYSFPRADKHVYTRLASTPLINREVTDIAIDLLRSGKLGNRGSDAMDMLNIGYTLAPFKDATDGNYRLELADAYIRLDRQLERLFSAIDENVGTENALIILSSTGYCDEAVAEDPRYRIPGGELSLKRAKSLLNAYMSAKYGNGEYIESITGNELRLNHKTLEDRRVAYREAADEARLFLGKMSGVGRVHTLEELLCASTPETESLQLSITPGHAGDLMITYQPGWTVIDDLRYPETRTVVRQSAVATPVFILGSGVKAEKITTPVDATAIAGAVAGILHIRSPNAANAPLK